MSASDVRRSKLSHLRVVAGRTSCPVEPIEFRVTEQRKTTGLLRVAIVPLLGALLLTGGAAGGTYLTWSPMMRLAPPLLGLSTALLAIDAVLIRHALHRLERSEHKGSPSWRRRAVAVKASNGR
ncbi:MAG: hypothetical protein ACHQ9S_25710 [Candidatus Binatia bacterium]